MGLILLYKARHTSCETKALEEEREDDPAATRCTTPQALPNRPTPPKIVELPPRGVVLAERTGVAKRLQERRQLPSEFLVLNDSNQGRKSVLSSVIDHLDKYGAADKKVAIGLCSVRDVKGLFAMKKNQVGINVCMTVRRWRDVRSSIGLWFALGAVESEKRRRCAHKRQLSCI